MVYAMLRAAGVAAAVALLVFGNTACREAETRCAICYMPVPTETRAIVDVDGQPRTVCDPRCALTFQEQTGQGVVLTVVTDFETGARLDPAVATYVTGSDTAPDAHTQALRTGQADAAYLHWHRCLPSVLAFAERARATRFQQSHGGTLMVLADLGFGGRDVGVAPRTPAAPR